MKDLTYDMDLEYLLRTCKALDYSQKEIKRLNNIIKRYDYCLKKELEKVYSDTFIKWKIRELQGSDEE